MLGYRTQWTHCCLNHVCRVYQQLCQVLCWGLQYATIQAGFVLAAATARSGAMTYTAQCVASRANWTAVRAKSFAVTDSGSTWLQCELMIRQGLVRRVFGEWQRLCQERDWKTQLATRDNEIKRMDREVCASVTSNLPCAHYHRLMAHMTRSCALNLHTREASQW